MLVGQLPQELKPLREQGYGCEGGLHFASRRINIHYFSLNVGML